MWFEICQYETDTHWTLLEICWGRWGPAGGQKTKTGVEGRPHWLRGFPSAKERHAYVVDQLLKEVLDRHETN